MKMTMEEIRAFEEMAEMLQAEMYEEIAKMYYRKEITNVQAAKILKMNRGTFFKYAKQYKNQTN